jgi:alkylated DNA repair dioxygenase AlkB
MDSLFPELTAYPPGFSYFPDFISEAEEQRLCELCASLDLQQFRFHGYLAKRKVASYGYDYHFNTRSITEGKPIPEGVKFLAAKVAEQCGCRPEEFAEVLFSEYPPESVINWHRDAPPFDFIAGVSLASDCVFRLRPYDKQKQNRKSIISLPVQRRSMYILRNEARSEWEHSILPVKQLRYSVTFRTLR